MRWEDTTSYSRGERGKVDPRTWEAKAGPLRVVVTRQFRLDGWYMSCDLVGLDVVPVSDDLEAAKLDAVAMVCGAVEQLAKYGEQFKRGFGLRAPTPAHDEAGDGE